MNEPLGIHRLNNVDNVDYEIAKHIDAKGPINHLK